MQLTPSSNYSEKAKSIPFSATYLSSCDYKAKFQYQLLYEETRLPTLSCFPREFTMLVLVYLVVVQQITSSTYYLVALTLILLAKWVYYDISIGNIILVKDEDNQQTRRISNLEYIQKFDSTSSSHKNLKIVIQIS